MAALYSERARLFLLFIQDSHCIRSNHQFFIGRNNHYFNLRVISRDYGFFTTYFVLFQVYFDAHEFQPFAYFATAVSAGMPPIDFVTSMAIGVVTDLGANE